MSLISKNEEQKRKKKTDMNITSALTINNFNMVTVAFIQSHIGCMYKFHISTVPLINGAKREIKRNETLTHTQERRAWSANDVDLHLTFCSFSTRFDCGIELNDSKNLYTNELREVKKNRLHFTKHAQIIFTSSFSWNGQSNIQIDLNDENGEKKVTHKHTQCARQPLISNYYRIDGVSVTLKTSGWKEMKRNEHKKK